MREWRANVEIAWVPELPGAASLLAGVHSETTPLAMVPSSMRRDDPVTAAIRPTLHAGGIRTVVVTPRSPAALFAHRGESSWRQTTIDGRRWRVDARLAAPWIAIATIDSGSRAGPFTLDLPARFLHPTDRIRLVTRPDRHRLLADIATIAPPATCLLLTPTDGGWLAVTTRDPIAAELWALGLAERFHPADMETQGLWEEPTVQRATELGLGVRIPQDMQVDASVSPEAPVARTLLYSIAERLGLSLDAENASG